MGDGYMSIKMDGRILLKKERERREFPGGLVVRILGFHFHGPGSFPGQELRSHKVCSSVKKKEREKERKKEREVKHEAKEGVLEMVSPTCSPPSHRGLPLIQSPSFDYLGGTVIAKEKYVRLSGGVETSAEGYACCYPWS